MDNIAGQRSSYAWAAQLAVAGLVFLWLIPTLGLLVSSFRDRDQISETGWWRSAAPVERAFRVSAPPAEAAERRGDLWVIEGTIFDLHDQADLLNEIGPEISAFGTSGFRPTAHPAGSEAELDEGLTLSVNADGTYRITSPDPIAEGGQRLYFGALMPPDFTVENYQIVLTSDNMDLAFINTVVVAVPATIIPILFAAFAAYALAWMDFPGRGLLIAAVVGLLVVPLQIALVPLLRLHEAVGIGQSFLGIWLAHTGYGIPLAIYLLRNYMIGLPRDIIECAKIDGATDFQIFTKIILPLSFPALASFAIFQFLWTWNDLLVAKVFLPSDSESWVMTRKIADDLLGSRGGDWGILSAAAFVSLAVPIGVFFAMQRYLVRGMLAGSVK